MSLRDFYRVDICVTRCDCKAYVSLVISVQMWNLLIRAKNDADCPHLDFSRVLNDGLGPLRTYEILSIAKEDRITERSSALHARCNVWDDAICDASNLNSHFCDVFSSDNARGIANQFVYDASCLTLRGFLKNSRMMRAMVNDDEEKTI